METGNNSTMPMVKTLAKYGSDSIKATCQKLLKAEDFWKAVEEEKKYCGSFLTAVLDGDFIRALGHADFQNQIALKHMVYDLVG